VPGFASTDSPKSAVPIKNHRYQIPRYPFDGPMPQGAEPVAGSGMLVPWTRMSTIVETHEDKEGIRKWRERFIVKGIGARADLYALAASTRLDEKFQLSGIADQAFDYAKGQAASNTGTALHGFLERHAKKELEANDIPEPWRSDVAAVLTAFQDANIRLIPHLQEMVIVRPDLKDGDSNGLAGRLDLMVEIQNPTTGAWELIMVDYKTGSDPLAYGAWKIQQQLGGYTTSWATWDGEFWHPMPPVIRDRVLMVHVLPGQASVQIHEGKVDPDELEDDLAAAYRTRRRRKEAKKAWRPLVTVEDGQLVGDDPLEGQDSPTEHPETVVTPDQQAQVDKAAERMAKLNEMAIKAGRNDEGDDEQDGPTVYRVSQVRDGEGNPIAPLAGEGKKGCSVCGRTGHRKGSGKCLGENDPLAKDTRAKAAASVPDAPEAKTHTNHEWTRNPISGSWECAIGGEQAAPEVSESMTREQENRADLAAAKASTPEPVVAEPTTQPISPMDVDPFEDDRDEVAAADADWHLFLDRINEAKSKAEIREIRAEATELKVWDDALLQAGLARIKAL
jgi:hypothetical protein